MPPPFAALIVKCGEAGRGRDDEGKISVSLFGLASWRCGLWVVTGWIGSEQLTIPAVSDCEDQKVTKGKKFLRN